MAAACGCANLRPRMDNNSFRSGRWPAGACARGLLVKPLERLPPFCGSDAQKLYAGFIQYPQSHGIKIKSGDFMYPLLTKRAAQLRVDERYETARGETARLQDQMERLRSCLRIAVIFGGDKAAPGSVLYKTSNTRSWKSYEAVAQDIAESLARIGFRNVQLLPEDMHLGDRLRRDGVHLAWLNSGGVQGYNSVGHAPAMLEMLGVPYVGHDSLSATTLDNKHVFKREAQFAGLPTAAFITWHMARGPFRPDLNRQFQRAFADYPGPFVVKPVSGRA